jgi:MFS transporter, NNP family, nitrate/nitrite transporter
MTVLAAGAAGARACAFMLIYGVAWVSLIWIYRSEVSTRDAVHSEPKPVV